MDLKFNDVTQHVALEANDHNTQNKNEWIDMNLQSLPTYTKVRLPYHHCMQNI